MSRDGEARHLRDQQDARDARASVNGAIMKSKRLATENEKLRDHLADASTVLHEIAVAATFLDRDDMAAHASGCLERISAGQATATAPHDSASGTVRP